MSEDLQKLIDPNQYKNFKAGFIAVIGVPNVGKSTLMNQLIEQKLSIVTRKAQTTRKPVLGILNGENFQIVFTDTPGIIDPQYNLQDRMMRYVKTAVKDADTIVYMVDIHDSYLKPNDVRDQLSSVKDKPVILVINKIDLVDKRLILPCIEKFKEMHEFRDIIPISAEKSIDLDRLITSMKDTLPLSPPFYPTDFISDQQERFFVSEIIREKIFKLYKKEVPYSTHVEIEAFHERENRKDYIRAVIFVERQTQKGILIGKKGDALKRVGEYARADIEQFLDREVFLELFVKVSPDWRKKDRLLRQLGYE